MRLSRMFITNGVVALLLLALGAACNMENWDWFGTKKNDKPVTKARKPANEPTVAAADRPKQSGTQNTDDAKAKEVDEKVDKYVRNMNQNQKYDPNYEGNDFQSKMRRQNDPNRQARIKQTAARTKENGDYPADSEPAPTRDSALAPTARPTETSSQQEPIADDSAKRDELAEQGTETAKNQPEPAPRTEPPVAANKSPVKTAPKIDDPGQTPEDTEPANTEPAEAKKSETVKPKPPVISEIKVTTAPPPEKPIEQSVTPDRAAANTPAVATPEPVDTFKKRLAEQEAAVLKDPNNVEEQFKLRLMYLVNGQDDKVTAAATGMNKEVEEILQAQLRALMSARSSAQRDPAAWANKQLDAVEELRSLVRSRADLRVPRIVLCKAIEGYGRYTPFDPAEFPAGKPNRVLIYIEVDNFTSEKTASGQHRVLLNMRQSLMSRAGEEIWSGKDENIEDLARQPRRDFYLIADRTIPKTLAPGEYVIKVEVEDVLAGKLNSASATLKLVGSTGTTAP